MITPAKDPLAETDSRPFPFLTAALSSVVIWGRRLALGLFVLVALLVSVQWAVIHFLLAQVSPGLAWIFTGLGLAIATGLLAWLSWLWWSVPRAITPPELPDPKLGWSTRDRERFLRFAETYLERQQRNPSLPEAAQALVPAAVAHIQAAAALENDVAVVKLVEDEIDRILEPLDKRARKAIWRAATEIAVLTAVNPSALLDVLITLLRNVELMVRISRLYDARPGWAGSARVVRDVLAAAVTAGIAERIAEGLADALSDLLGSWTVRLAGPVGQGLTNGLLTVRLGETAVARCRALRSRRVGIAPWSRAMWREGAQKLSRLVSERVGPELGRRFRRIAGDEEAPRGPGRAVSWLREKWRGEKRADEIADSEGIPKGFPDPS